MLFINHREFIFVAILLIASPTAFIRYGIVVASYSRRVISVESNIHFDK